MLREHREIGLGMLAVAIFATTVGLAGAEDAEETFRERFTARAVAMGTSHPPILPRGQTARLDINVTRWTTDEERDQLFKTLVEGGQSALTPALRGQAETGWVRVIGPNRSGRTTTFPRETLRYAREFTDENGGRRLVLAADRPITLYEMRNRPRWRDHDITMFVIVLDAEDTGSGQLAIGVQLQFVEETGTLAIENFGSEPVRLTSVRAETR